MPLGNFYYLIRRHGTGGARFLLGGFGTRLWEVRGFYLRWLRSTTLGDVRGGSVKRVLGCVGEVGATAPQEATALGI